MEDEAIAESELKWICFDLDKTIATNSPYPEYKLLDPIIGAKESLEQLNAQGWKIIIFTSRAWMEYEQIERWLDKYNIPHRRIICGKTFAKYYVDDRNIEFNGDWKPVLRKIK
jgi:hydroxymethylpyrimidine pyrophosphatase-like HAD family hydrolase